MLRQLRSGDDHLGSRHVVVGEEDHLQEVSDAVVIVDFLRNGSDELDESLGVVVAGSSLSADHDDAGHELLLSLTLRSSEDLQVSVDNVENVHQLTLVLVNTLNLDVVKSINGNIKAGVLLHPGLELNLVLSLNVDEPVDEVLVAGVGHQLGEVIKASHPLVDAAHGVAEQVRQLGVAAVDPSARSHSVGLVLNFAGVELVELLEDGGSQEVRVEGSHSVDGVGANDGEVGHPDLLGEALLDETHAHDLGIVSGVLLSELLQVDVVDKVDQLHVARQQVGDQVNRPLLEGLGQHSVVGVGEGVVDHVPCLLEGELLLVDQDSQELNS
mmetsp:Transcript_26895/g.40991  ORF Transcript_26895/g.40991 Transcript_26895/m.40991 type:complete len:327 (-) Transcript_26895:1261-2241(-)